MDPDLPPLPEPGVTVTAPRGLFRQLDPLFRHRDGRSGAGAHISGLGLGDRPHGVPSDEHLLDGASLHARHTPRTAEYTAIHAASLGALRRSARAAPQSAKIIECRPQRSGTLQSYDYTVRATIAGPIAAQCGHRPTAPRVNPGQRPLCCWPSVAQHVYTERNSQRRVVRVPSSAAYGCIDERRASTARSTLLFARRNDPRIDDSSSRIIAVATAHGLNPGRAERGHRVECARPLADDKRALETGDATGHRVRPPAIPSHILGGCGRPWLLRSRRRRSRAVR